MASVTCPVCGHDDQVQSVRAIVEGGTYRGTQVDSISSYQSYAGTAGGKWYVGGGPVTGTAYSSLHAQTDLARTMGLREPDPPEKPGFGGNWVLLAIFGLIGYIIPGIIVIVGRYMYLNDQHSQAMASYESAREQYRRYYPQWAKLCFCHRDNVVFIPGDGRGAVSPYNMRRLIESPPTPAKHPLPASSQSVQPAAQTTQTVAMVYHVMLEVAGPNPDAVIGLVAKLTSLSREEAAALVAKFPTRLAKYETQAEAGRLKDLLEAVGAEASVMSQSVVPNPPTLPNRLNNANQVSQQAQAGHYTLTITRLGMDREAVAEVLSRHLSMSQREVLNRMGYLPNDRPLEFDGLPFDTALSLQSALSNLGASAHFRG